MSSMLSMGFLDLFKSKENRKIKQFDARLDEIETQMRLMRLEWQESYDKIHHALDRVGKRWSRITEKSNGSSNGDEKTVTTTQTVENLWKIARERGLVR